MFGDFPIVFLLFLIWFHYGQIIVLCDFNSFNFLMLVLWLRMSIFVKVPCVLEKTVYCFCWVKCSVYVGSIYVSSDCVIQLFVSLLVLIGIFISIVFNIIIDTLGFKLALLLFLSCLVHLILVTLFLFLISLWVT